jgi:uncharacterized protein (TIGR02270 family)
MLAARPIPWDIYEEHLDEAAFLWGQWEQALDAANYTLGEVIDGPEERLLAHLDGLVLGGKPVADRLLIPALAHDDAGKIRTAAWALMQAEDADHLGMVIDALAQATRPEAREAITRAFELSHRGDLPARLLPMMEKSPPSVQAMIVTVVSAWARPPEPGKQARSQLPLGKLLETRNPEVLVAALRALRRAPDPAFAGSVDGPLASPYVAIRDTAIQTGMILGMRAAWRACSKLVARNATGARLPLALLALGGEPVDLKAVIKRLAVPTMRRDALWALGFAGKVEAAEAALALIGDAELGALAGESFATITGAPLMGRLIEIGQTDNAAPPEIDQEDDDADAPLPVVKPEDDLPIPRPDAVRAWWKTAKPNFQSEVRYLYGHPVTPEALRGAIAAGPTWRRRVWCLEVAMRGGFDVNMAAWARKQREATLGLQGGFRIDRALTTLSRV